MVDSAPRTGLGWLWSAFDAVRERVESDGDLLGRFVHDRDEQAFGELVRRLGPTVYGVCCRHLGNTADADDAFQATFLVLSRKAGTVHPPGKVAAWVYGVANLAARKLRQARHRRLLRERAVHPLPDPPSPEKEMDSTLQPAVDEELGRLPDNFRLPILMCGVRGMTVADAAAELGWPVGTVASRLSRGRAELAKRLAKRGITFGAVALTARGCGELAARVPPQLIERTVAVVAGDALPPAVAALSSEVVNVMTWSPIRRLTAGLLCVSGLALAGGGVLVSNGTAAPVPVAQAPGESKTLDRVKLGDVSGLLRQESVRKEIGLSEDEYKKLTEFLDGKQAGIQQAVQNDIQAQIKAQQGGGGPGRAISVRSNSDLVNKLTGDMHSEYAKKVSEQVKPDGVKRLKQAVLQAAGARTLLDRLVIRELQLTAEQEDRIDAQLVPQADEPITADTVGKLAEARDAELAAALKLLTAEQKKKWDALVGKPLPTAELLAASPHSDESFKATMKGMQFRAFGGIQILPAVPGVPFVPPAPPVEVKKEK